MLNVYVTSHTADEGTHPSPPGSSTVSIRNCSFCIQRRTSFPGEKLHLKQTRRKAASTASHTGKRCSIFYVVKHKHDTLFTETNTKRTMDPEGPVRATLVTAGHCTHAELTSGHALAGCYSCCVNSRGLSRSMLIK